MSSSKRTASPVLPSALAGVATDNITTGAELVAAGISRSTIAQRCKAGGPWRRLLPGVILLEPGKPSRRQLLRAVICHLGKHSVITGVDALLAHGVEMRLPRSVHVLVPTDRRILGTEHTVPERTTRLPEPRWIHGLPFAAPPRAAIDAARREREPGRLHAQLQLPVSDGLCTPEQLWEELDAGNQRGTSAVRDALRGLGSDTHVAYLGLAKRILRRSALPAPSWQTVVCDRFGHQLGSVDAWWDELAVGWQFSSEPGARSHLGLTAAGVALVRSPVERLRNDPARVLTELADALCAAARRSRPAVRGHQHRM